ncbi:laccase, putative [Talaromyces stipitatus ATCC 10500]|uniref:Laccase, putative n=1 Tax=Talaromyces stipitatus (strain ATCC 10500 / CBS 375.48 / QM 6759 / NRRL 1006) TaxID=441959 RepID=B8M678_TALSN|nr:laccase, putative [Talaromyces stipitatus ATCC 10500]EED19078.1 laccase, putative [Talaromyces stipitatus ATCC 10500]
MDHRVVVSLCCYGGYFTLLYPTAWFNNHMLKTLISNGINPIKVNLGRKPRMLQQVQRGSHLLTLLNGSKQSQGCVLVLSMVLVATGLAFTSLDIPGSYLFFDNVSLKLQTGKTLDQPTILEYQTAICLQSLGQYHSGRKKSWPRHVIPDWNLERSSGVKSMSILNDYICLLLTDTSPVIAINGVWPAPMIRGTVNDTVVVKVHNSLGNQSLSIHWHGLHMVVSVLNVHCMQLDEPGTYWYHSHSPSQYVDGIRGPILVDDPFSPYADQIDGELVVTLSDWYHVCMLTRGIIALPGNPTALEPIPMSALMNDQLWPTLSVLPNKTYFLRVLNIAGYAQFYFHIDAQHMTIIQADGVYTDLQLVQDLYLATGQRYGVLLHTLPTASQNYVMLGAMDIAGFPGSAPTPVSPNVTGVLVYDPYLSIPSTPLVEQFIAFDDFCLTPIDSIPLLDPPNKEIVLNLSTFSQVVPLNEQNRGGFNNITYITQRVPSLYTALSGGLYALNPIVYGNHSNAFVLNLNDIVETTIYNYDTGLHPIHTHGHNVQLIYRTGSSCKNRTIPMRRDTWMEPRWNSLDPNHPSTVVRFVADNPGIWFLHCHMEWHLVAGMDIILVEDPLQIQRGQRDIPLSMKLICLDQKIPLKGNAAGNWINFLDLTGEVNVAPMECGSLSSTTIFKVEDLSTAP